MAYSTRNTHAQSLLEPQTCDQGDAGSTLSHHCVVPFTKILYAHAYYWFMSGKSLGLIEKLLTGMQSIDSSKM